MRFGADLRKYWPPTIALILLYLIVVFAISHSMKQNDGHFVYPLDDPYIHMAIAKNVVLHHTWGATAGEFSSTSSSPLWTALLSLLFFLFGIRDEIPLVLNLFFGSFLILAASHALRQYTQNFFLILISLIVIVLSIPMPTLVLSGQEHTLHILLSGVFAYMASRVLAQNPIPWKGFRWLLVLAPLLVLTRYEGLFLAFAVCILFLIRKDIRKAVALGFMAALPVVIYGVISVSKGWYFLPNSVILKGNVPHFSSVPAFLRFVFKGYVQMVRNPEILLLLIGVAFFWYIQRRKQDPDAPELNALPAIFIITTLLHLQFAIAGWFYRYEAYLVGLGLWILALFVCAIKSAGSQFLPEKRALPFFILFVFLSPFFLRAYNSLPSTILATTNIYQQHIQMATFLKKYYSGQSIAANDIGAINYYADIRCVDLWGLANKEVGRARLNGNYDTQTIDRITKQQAVKIAVIYEHWFYSHGGVPKHWFKVGEWKIQYNIVGGGDVVSFYIVDPAEAVNLVRNLQAYSPQLPKTVLRSIAVFK